MYNKKTMQELPVQERPYEKCLSYGPEHLSDSELLAIILRSGVQGNSSLELARKILELGDMDEGLLAIHHISIQELMKIKGIGKVKAIQIKCIGELSKRIAGRSAKKLLDFNDPDTIADYYMERLRHEEQEQIICMMLDTKNHLLGETVISKGTVNASIITPREILLSALRYRAVYIILIHNHPSGNPLPSKDDVLLTQRVKEACTIVQIPLLDHIIIGDQCYVSFRKDGILT